MLGQGATGANCIVLTTVWRCKGAHAIKPSITVHDAVLCMSRHQADKRLRKGRAFCTAAEPGSFLQQFFGATANMSPAERGRFLEHPPGDAPGIEEAHQVRGQALACQDKQGPWADVHVLVACHIAPLQHCQHIS